ncbi:MAG: hypothetical protein KF847_08055 [Pirellulales bacterium]|nr:hypothetical protein [Pirellulales bacterium]
MTTRLQQYVRRLLTVALAVVAAPQADSCAATWGGGVGSYTTGSNWIGGVVPSGAETVTISSGQATNSGNLSRAAATTIDGSGELVVNGRLLNAQNGAAVLTVADNGVLTHAGEYFLVSTSNVDGAINQTGGTVNATVSRGFFLTDGSAGNPGNGTYNALGGVLNAELVSTSGDNLHNFQAGRRGVNDAFNVNGGNVNFTTGSANRRIYFSQNSKLQVDSGVYSATGFQHFVIGYGTSVAGGNLSGTARMLVNGGTTNIVLSPTGIFTVSDGQSGVVQVSGGALNVTGRMVIGGDVTANNNVGRGDVVQTGGTVGVSGEIAMGVNAPGTYRISGGTLNAGSLAQGGQIDSFFGFEGGTVVLDGNVTTVLNESWFAAPYGATAAYNGGTDKTTITRNPAIQGIRLEVNTQTGEAKIRNPNGAFAFTTDYYEIRSAQGALIKANWNSLDDQIPDGGLVAGDYNGDGVANGSDFLRWQRQFGMAAVPPGSGADGNGNGVVDAADLGVWKTNYGSSGGGIGSGWTEAGGSNANLLAEYFLDASSYTLAANASLSLGNIFNTATFGVGNPGDLTFGIETPNGYLVNAEVVYVNPGPAVGASAAVPEPAAIVLGATLGAALLAVRRRG